jgi:TPR repeat protein
MYGLGDGVLEDVVTAYAWFNISAANGEADGKKNKGIVAKKMTAEDISKAQELLKEMVKMERLNDLVLDNTQITDAGMAELKKALPECRISK